MHTHKIGLVQILNDIYVYKIGAWYPHCTKMVDGLTIICFYLNLFFGLGVNGGGGLNFIKRVINTREINGVNGQTEG